MSSLVFSYLLGYNKGMETPSLTPAAQTPDILDDALLSREERITAARILLYGDETAVRAILPRLNAKVIGRMSSPQKAASSRENGKRGGRPRKNIVSPASC